VSSDYLTRFGWASDTIYMAHRCRGFPSLRVRSVLLIVQSCSLRAILVFSLLFIISMRKMRLVFLQVTDSFQINRPHVAYTILGGFTSIFMLCSLFIKEKLYIGEASEFPQESLGDSGRAPRADGRV